MQDKRINDLARRLEAFMTTYGYERIETPIIQPADLFLTKAGDQIINRLFTFERLGKQLALRPEFTALAAHTYVTRHDGADMPVERWQFSGAIFEEGAGDTQHYSIGAELLGMGGAAAEAEIMALAAHGIASEDVSGCRLVVGHVRLMRALLAQFSLDSRTQRFLLSHLHALQMFGKAHVLDQLDKLLLGKGIMPPPESGDAESSELGTQQMLDALLDATQHGATMGGRTRHDIVRRLLQKRQRATERQQIIAALDFLEAWSAIRAAPDEAFAAIEQMIAPDDAQARAILDEWRSVIALLDAYDIPAARIEIQPALARSWDYYTGIVFELWAQGAHLGGGGRYDDLTRLVGGENAVPAVGFAYYIDPLLDALPEAGTHHTAPISIYADATTQATAIRWAQELRARGHAVALNSGGQDDAFVAAADGSLRRRDQTYTTLESLIVELERTP